MKNTLLLLVLMSSNVVAIEQLIIKKIIDNANVIGSVLIHDLNNDKYFSNDFNWAKIDHLPASTFKIPNSLIAIELGIADKKTVFKWDGNKRNYKVWQQDLTLKQAFHYSCVPCFQDVARQIGVERMNNYLNKLEFGVMDVNKDTINQFWLIGKSNINQYQQINFLKRLYHSQLPLSKNAQNYFKQMFISKKTKGYTIRAKTGLSVSNHSYNGWYVGYIETKSNVFFFATNISPKDNYDKSFNNKRKNITIQALKELKIIK